MVSHINNKLSKSLKSNFITEKILSHVKGFKSPHFTNLTNQIFKKKSPFIRILQLQVDYSNIVFIL